MNMRRGIVQKQQSFRDLICLKKSPFDGLAVILGSLGCNLEIDLVSNYGIKYQIFVYPRFNVGFH